MLALGASRRSRGRLGSRGVPGSGPRIAHAGSERSTAARSSRPTNPLNRGNRGCARQPATRPAYVASIGLSAHLHPDFGTNPSYGIPYTVVGPDQPKVPIKFTEYGAESDPGPYPVPPDAPIEGGGKNGAAATNTCSSLQEGSCKLYELYKAHRKGAGWNAASGAVFNLRSNALRPEGWTSADAAGLPIFPLLVRYPEVRSGRIDHALRVTVPQTQRGYIHPATHFASSSSNPDLPPMGLRLRLKASYSLAGFHGESLIDPRGAQALRADRRRQRLAVVHHRRARPALERRRPRTDQAGARL